MKTWSPKEINYIKPATRLAWEPLFTEQSGALYVKFNPGLVNNFLPVNISESFVLPKTGKVYFSLDVTSNYSGAEFSLSSVKISVSNQAPSQFKAQKGTPPDKISICLGLYDEGQYFMFYKQNISLFSQLLFTTEKEGGPASVGEDPFDKWWGWVIF